MIFLAAEGGATFANWVMTLDGLELWPHPAPFVLIGSDRQSGSVAEVLQHLEAIGDSPFDLKIFDKVACVMGAIDKNNRPDIANLMRSLDLIRWDSGVLVMLNHCGGNNVG